LRAVELSSRWAAASWRSGGDLPTALLLELDSGGLEEASLRCASSSSMTAIWRRPHWGAPPRDRRWRSGGVLQPPRTRRRLCTCYRVVVGGGIPALGKPSPRARWRRRPRAREALSSRSPAAASPALGKPSPHARRRWYPALIGRRQRRPRARDGSSLVTLIGSGNPA
jgi:hypothetical protein